MNEKLKQDFPIDWEDDHFVTRREFFRFLTLASGGLAVGTAALAAYASIPKTRLDFEAAAICKVDDLKNGSSLAFSFPRPNDLCLLIRRQDGTFAGFKRRCTHLSCPVDYDVREGQELLYCPCHNGAFSLEDGRVVQGPPPHPLPQIQIEIRGDEIWALGVMVEKHA